AVFRVGVDGGRAGAPLLAPLAVALVVDFFALDLAFVIGGGLSGELGRERLAYAQGARDLRDLAGWHCRHVPCAAHLDRGHDTQLAHDAPAPPQQAEPDERRDAGENRKKDIHELPQRPKASIARVARLPSSQEKTPERLLRGSVWNL